MTRLAGYFCFGALAFSPCLAPADGFLEGLFNFGKEERVSAQQLSNQTGPANAQLERARQLQANGNRRKARDTYKSIVKSYPRTEAAAEAQFQYAKIRDAEGDDRKAFEEYTELIENYPNTPKFTEAIRRQFAIAESLHESDKKGFLGIGAAIQPSKLIEMFQQIKDAAPQTEYAPRSLLNIGRVQAERGETTEAIGTFQTVVDNYGGTDYASDAQYRIFELRGIKAEKSNSPVEDRAQVEAGLDFVNQNPEDQRADEIESNLDAIEERSMKKLYDTGRFYENKGKPESARVYYREVVKNPDTQWAAKARERLRVIENSPDSVKERAGFFGSNPLKDDEVEMRTSDDDVVPLPVDEANSAE